MFALFKKSVTAQQGERGLGGQIEGNGPGSALGLIRLITRAPAPAALAHAIEQRLAGAGTFSWCSGFC